MPFWSRSGLKHLTQASKRIAQKVFSNNEKNTYSNLHIGIAGLNIELRKKERESIRLCRVNLFIVKRYCVRMVRVRKGGGGGVTITKKMIYTHALEN